MPDSQTELRAGLIHKSYLAHQGVEDDDVSVICRGRRRGAKVAELEGQSGKSVPRESGS